MQQIKRINFHIPELDSMKKYPQELYYIGNTNLLKNKKIGIVGSRHPNQYSQNMTYKISSKLSESNICIVSGGAMGIDTLAHKVAGTNNTIMISGTGLDIRYPRINQKLISDIEENGLVLSQFPPNTPSLPRNFAIRNELIVALSDIIIVPYADLKSGSMRSIEYAIKMNKEIYVLPHRLGESDGTNQLLAEKKAIAVYDIDDFISQFNSFKHFDSEKDDFLNYCKLNPILEEAIKKYGDKVFEYELLGKISIINGRIKII